LLSIEDITEGGSGIVIYPNPSRGFATARIPATFGNDVQITIVELGSGKIVRDYRATNGERDLDFSGYSDGVYVIKFVSETSSSTHRLVLAKK
ncbi:MAG TPA: T9SS type A sorting domain-containing protein, partial [Aequorivita sp.]|nr:T9SS type A sorting domain-containing protein [Aequorivita sp.]